MDEKIFDQHIAYYEAMLEKQHQEIEEAIGTIPKEYVMMIVEMYGKSNRFLGESMARKECYLLSNEQDGWVTVNNLIL